MNRTDRRPAQQWWKLEGRHYSHLEKLVAGIGGGLGILGTLWLSGVFLGADAAVLIVPSFGASAVLLFAVPHGTLSQPWNLLGGHLISAVVGVFCAQAIPDVLFAASAAVGAACLLMYYARCIHPPGGATALAAVIGGESIHSLGYGYVLTPILLNTLVILLLAVVINFPFRWRRYPMALSPSEADVSRDAYPSIEHGDLVYAISQIDSIIDVSEQDLLKIYALATRGRPPDEVDSGSNGDSQG